jgi:hypothetical protein
MMRARLNLALSYALRGTAVFAMGLWFTSIPGCSTVSGWFGSSHQNDMMPASSDAAAVENSQSQQPNTNKDDDKTMKCEQLVHHPPGIEEIRRTAQLGIESREIRVERSANSYRWVVYRSHGSAPDGWHSQSALDKLHFNPALQFLLPDKESKYLAYAPSVAETPQDSEQMMSIADEFGQKAGTFEWNGRSYTYTISQHLPCFVEPED